MERTVCVYEKYFVMYICKITTRIQLMHYSGCSFSSHIAQSVAVLSRLASCTKKVLELLCLVEAGLPKMPDDY